MVFWPVYIPRLGDHARSIHGQKEPYETLEKQGPVYLACCREVDIAVHVYARKNAPSFLAWCPFALQQPSLGFVLLC
jgi:hypothetical protein